MLRKKRADPQRRLRTQPQMHSSGRVSVPDMMLRPGQRRSSFGGASSSDNNSSTSSSRWQDQHHPNHNPYVGGQDVRSAAGQAAPTFSSFAPAKKKAGGGAPRSAWEAEQQAGQQKARSNCHSDATGLESKVQNAMAELAQLQSSASALSQTGPIQAPPVMLTRSRAQLARPKTSSGQADEGTDARQGSELKKLQGVMTKLYKRNVVLRREVEQLRKAQVCVHVSFSVFQR